MVLLFVIIWNTVGKIVWSFNCLILICGQITRWKLRVIWLKHSVFSNWGTTPFIAVCVLKYYERGIHVCFYWKVGKMFSDSLFLYHCHFRTMRLRWVMIHALHLNLFSHFRQLPAMSLFCIYLCMFVFICEFSSHHLDVRHLYPVSRDHRFARASCFYNQVFEVSWLSSFFPLFLWDFSAISVEIGGWSYDNLDKKTSVRMQLLFMLLSW